MPRSGKYRFLLFGLGLLIGGGIWVGLNSGNMQGTSGAAKTNLSTTSASAETSSNAQASAEIGEGSSANPSEVPSEAESAQATMGDQSSGDAIHEEESPSATHQAKKTGTTSAPQAPPPVAASLLPNFPTAQGEAKLETLLETYLTTVGLTSGPAASPDGILQPYPFSNPPISSLGLAQSATSAGLPPTSADLSIAPLPLPMSCLKELQKLLDKAAPIVKSSFQSSTALCTYKYPLRALAEQALSLTRGPHGNSKTPPASNQSDLGNSNAISGTTDSNGLNNQGSNFFLDSDGKWQLKAQGWDFSPFEEAVYQAYFTNSQRDFPLSRSIEIFLAVRTRNAEKMLNLHNLLGLGPAPEYPLQAFYELYGNGYSPACGLSVEKRLEALLEVGELTASCQNKDWCEFRYGTGTLFPVLRQKLGSKSKIYAVEIDGSCKRLLNDLQKFKQFQLENLIAIDGEYNNCKLPAQSVDIVHCQQSVFGVQDKDTWQRDGLVLLASIKQALKPNGCLLVEFENQLQCNEISELMKQAGFRLEVIRTLSPTEPSDTDSEKHKESTETGSQAKANEKPIVARQIWAASYRAVQQ